MAITPDDLRAVESFAALAYLFNEKLDWPKATWSVFGEVADLYGLEQGDIPGVVSLAAVEKLDDDQTWGIFLVDFGENELKRQELRRILQKVADRARQEHDNPTWPHEDILFICKSKGNTWTLAHFRGDVLANAKLRTFGWEDPDKARTTLENLNRLQWGGQAQWTDAWNVERLTKAFFTDYRIRFEQVEQLMVPTIADAAIRRRFVQALFNRLMFICFLQRKEWLDLRGERKRYLFALHATYAQAEDERGFYDRLRKLFFSGLNSPNGIGGQNTLEPELGKVPFLNGGLFEPHPALDIHANFVPDEAFSHLLGPAGLFQAYNFTVTEATPMDEDVAIDPEMLGKVFEELVTGRHVTGSYYTPRPIVSFMCREALKGYLSQTPGVEPSKIEPLVDEHDAQAITIGEARVLIAKLKTATVCDPACGSGAYLLGMLHELFALRQILDTKDEQSSAADDYDRKVGIIRNNLYGVDLDILAVNIAWLRVWLALIIEDTRNPIDDGVDVSLPNIDAKIAQGDSLLGPGPAISQAALQDDNLIDEIREKRGRYITAHGPMKRELDDKIKSLKDQLAANLGHPSLRAEGPLDWVVEFPEVLLPREQRVTIGGRMNLGQSELVERPDQVGYDMILANPPYVRHELITAIKPQLRQVYGENYVGTADLYTYFYLRSVALLKPGGMLVYISSNKWFKAAYGEKLRAFMASETRIESITDFGELPVFQTAATFPMIIVAKKGRVAVQIPVFTQVKTLEPPYPDVKPIIGAIGNALPPDAVSGSDWILADLETLQALRTMRERGKPLGEYVNGQIFYGIKTGCNEAFVIDTPTRDALIAADPQSAEIIKPLAVGDDVRKWLARNTGKWLIVTKVGVDIQSYAAVFAHLSKWKDQLQVRQDTGPHWWELRACTYYSAFDKPKISFPEICKEPRFAFDQGGIFTNNKAFIVPLDDLYLLAVMNSYWFWEYTKRVCSALGDEDKGGRMMLQWVNLQKVPVPPASAADRAAIEALVQRILDLKDGAEPSIPHELRCHVHPKGPPVHFADPPDFDNDPFYSEAAREQRLQADRETEIRLIEAEIDARVEFLYFDADKAPDYDTWLAQRESEKGTVIEEVRSLLKISHETLMLECKSSFMWGVQQGDYVEALKDQVHIAICALLNAKGGDLLIGVEELPGDILSVRGLEEDLRRYAGKDGLLSAIEQPLGKTLMPNPIGLVEMKAVDIDGKTIIRVHVTADSSERYSFKEQIYVRRNTKSKPALSADEAAVWWPKRQRGEV